MSRLYGDHCNNCNTPNVRSDLLADFFGEKQTRLTQCMNCGECNVIITTNKTTKLSTYGTDERAWTKALRELNKVQ